MSNLYSAPGADLSQFGADAGTYQPQLFSTKGRIGRARYCAYLFGGTLLLGLGLVGFFYLIGTARLDPSTTRFLPLSLTATGFGFAIVLAIRRLNDMGNTGWLSILSLVPIVNIGVSLWLLFGPGDKGANKYGPAPCKNSQGVVIVCVITVAVAILVLAFAAFAAFGVYLLNSAGLSGLPR